MIRAEADLALRNERTPEEYRQALETIAAESDALEALTHDLLTAARDNSNAEDVRGPVDLALVASAVIQRTSVLAGTRGVHVERRCSEQAIVHGNRTLIERAVLGVLHNALKYSPEAGTVEVRVSLEAQLAQLTVSDDGPGFSQAALLRAFDRFWRDDAARGRDGTGLGLSLAKTIVERYGGGDRSRERRAARCDRADDLSSLVSFDGRDNPFATRVVIRRKGSLQNSGI